MKIDAPRAAASQLPASQQDRLARILDDFVAGAERGEPLSPEELLARHPADAEYLRPYLSGLRLFQGIAAEGPERPFAPGSALFSPSLPASWTIGDFTLVREIGRGGMGVVYEAEQISLRRRVALKVLPDAAARNAKQLSRFRNEAQAAAQAQHPHIVPVFAVGEAQGVHYFAMQLIDGRSLADLTDATDALIPVDPLAKSTVPATGDTFASAVAAAARSKQPPAAAKAVKLDAATVARFGQQAADALHAAHEIGVVHRDVKPSNLLVDRDGKLWVVDFGLARCREGSDLTRTGDICGTMRYMSPEQALGQPALVEHRTDIYSLGVTLFELATGEHPAGDLGDLHAYFDRSAVARKTMRQCNARVPRDFETIVLKAISDAPGDRYATAKEFADDLGRFLAHEPILATPPSRMTRVRKWAHRHRVAVGAIACMAIVTVAGLMMSLSYGAGQRAEMQKAAQEALANNQLTSESLYDLSLGAAEMLKGIPDTEAVRWHLLEQGLGFYQQLIDREFRDPAVGAELALAYSKVGGLRAAMGDGASALAAHRQARTILEGLTAAEPDNREYQRHLALARNNAGLLLAELDRSDEAARELGAAEDIQQQLRNQWPQWPDVTEDLAATNANFGLLARRQGAMGEAARRYRAAIALQEPLLDAYGDDVTLLDSLAASYSNLGSLGATIPQADPTIAHERAIDLQKRLMKLRPLDHNYQAALARSYNNLGSSAAAVHDWAGAQSAYDNAVLLQTRLVEASRSASYRRDLAVTRNNQGMALAQMGRLADATEEFQGALAQMQSLAKSRPDDASLLSHLGGIYNNIGSLHERQGLLQEAAEAFVQAIDHQRRALERQSQNLHTRELLSNHYLNYARNQQHLGRHDLALEALTQRQELWVGDAERYRRMAAEVADAARRSPTSTASPN